MRHVWLLAGLTALLGCNDPVKISNADRQTPYAPALVRFAVKSGELTAVIHGNPFPTAMDAETIASAIHLPGWLPRGTRLTTRPSPPTPTNIRVVLAFQPTWRGVREEWLCDSSAKLELAPAGGKLIVAAALCVDAKPVSWLQGEGEAAASPAAKSFQNLMNQVMANLLPDREL
ncbi:hypothetical protein [Desertibaculum subflavum]|uniref:hypothetical protein n=1 Tax=Desertibaculum subflavum TaxID=2268458 RepID=UPI000E66AAEC